MEIGPHRPVLCVRGAEFPPANIQRPALGDWSETGGKAARRRGVPELRLERTVGFAKLQIRQVKERLLATTGGTYNPRMS